MVGSLGRTDFVKLISHGIPLEKIEKAQEWVASSYLDSSIDPLLSPIQNMRFSALDLG